MTEDDDLNSDFCPTCGDPTVADSHRRAAMNEVREALSPILDWYQSDEVAERPTLDIIRDIVSDMQADRQVLLKAMSAIRIFLKTCSCADIAERNYGPAFDAASKARDLELKLGTERFADKEAKKR